MKMSPALQVDFQLVRMHSFVIVTDCFGAERPRCFADWLRVGNDEFAEPHTIQDRKHVGDAVAYFRRLQAAVCVVRIVKKNSR